MRILTLFVTCIYAGKVPDAVKRWNKIKGVMNDHVARLDSEPTISDRWIARINEWTKRIQDSIERVDTNCARDDENTDEEDTRLNVEDDNCLNLLRLASSLRSFLRTFACSMPLKREIRTVKRIQRYRNVVNFLSNCPKSPHPHWDVLIDIKRNLENIIIADRYYYSQYFFFWFPDEDPETARECRANIEENMNRLLKKLSYATNCKPNSQGPYHPDIKLETDLSDLSEYGYPFYEDYLLGGSGQTNLYKQISRFLQDYACENPVKEKDWDPFWFENFPSTSDPNPPESTLLYHFLGDTALAQSPSGISSQDAYGVRPKDYSLEGIFESLIGCSGIRPLSIK